MFYPLAMNEGAVTCPTCFETFHIHLPPVDEQPTEWDYDCEICCRPMLLLIENDHVEARGLGA